MYKCKKSIGLICRHKKREINLRHESERRTATLSVIKTREAA